MRENLLGMPLVQASRDLCQPSSFMMNAWAVAWLSLLIVVVVHCFINVEKLDNKFSIVANIILLCACAGEIFSAYASHVALQHLINEGIQVTPSLRNELGKCAVIGLFALPAYVCIDVLPGKRRITEFGPHQWLLALGLVGGATAANAFVIPILKAIIQQSKNDVNETIRKMRSGPPNVWGHEIYSLACKLDKRFGAEGTGLLWCSLVSVGAFLFVGGVVISVFAAAEKGQQHLSTFLLGVAGSLVGLLKMFLIGWNLASVTGMCKDDGTGEADSSLMSAAHHHLFSTRSNPDLQPDDMAAAQFALQFLRSHPVGAKLGPLLVTKHAMITTAARAAALLPALYSFLLSRAHAADCT
mmetsp:Transcript_139269/g.277700  ORF Transcript_139269/g.277700 Transcript_139269/m.277700 type:complete len:356 (-) Transcript_139269:106-1173(-)